MPYLECKSLRRNGGLSVGVTIYMSGTQASDWRFPSVCPVCNAATGTPFGTHSDADTIEVFVRCPTCLNVWKLTSERPPVVWKAKPDRRQT